MPARTRRGRAAGLALLTVLVVAFLVVILAMVLVAVSALDYRMARQQVDHARAFEAAQAALSQAIYNLADDNSWGTHGEILQATMASDGSRYIVSFVPGSESAWSTNGLGNPASVKGWAGHVVPPRSVLVFATGLGPGGQSTTLEAVFVAPPIPYAIAASGQVVCGDFLVVDGAASANSLVARLFDLPTSIYAGSTSSAAIQIGQSGAISGEARTPGGVVVGNGTSVTQGILTHATADTIPDIPIQSFSTAAYEGRTVLRSGIYDQDITLSGPVYVSGNVEFGGNVMLDNAVIFVDGGGNLYSQGDMHGTGSIFATGAVTLEGNIELMATDGIAVFSQGALNLMGGNFFQGMLYSHQSVKAVAGTHLIGAIACMSPAGGNVTLGASTHVTYLPSYARLLGSSGGGPLHMNFWREMPTP